MILALLRFIKVCSVENTSFFYVTLLAVLCYHLIRCSNTIPKSQFVKKKNDILEPEPFVQCDECGRMLHTICVLHNSSIWPEG